MSLRDLRLLLLSQKRVVAAAVVIALLGGLAVYLITPNSYSASTTLYVTSQSNDNSANNAYQGSLLSENRVKSYQEILTSPLLAEQVSTMMGGTPSAEQLTNDVDITSEAETVLLTVRVSDRDPERAAQIANTYGRVFTDTVARLERPSQQNQAPPVAGLVALPAAPPSEPASPVLGTDLVAGFLVGVLLGLGLALYRERSDSSIKTSAELEEASGAPAIGSVLIDDSIDDDPVVVTSRPSSLAAEAYRKIRTNLQYLNVDDSANVLMITSSLPEEGKSTTALNVAAALSSSGSAVLLLDADLRRPNVAVLSRSERQAGLTSVLSGRIPALSAVQRRSKNLHVVTAGPIPPNPSELLGSQAMEKVVESYRQNYDWILIDSPPTLPVADAAVIAKLCDGVLILCRQRATSRHAVEQAVNTLRFAGTRVIGSILTMVSPETGRPYTSYYPVAQDSASSTAQHSIEHVPSTTDHPFRSDPSRSPTPHKRSS